MTVDLRKKIILEVNGEFNNGYAALVSLGYMDLEDKVETRKGFLHVYEKNGQKVAYVSMDHINSYINSVTVVEVTDKIDTGAIVREGKVDATRIKVAGMRT